jgi:hypothetical protein
VFLGVSFSIFVRAMSSRSSAQTHAAQSIIPLVQPKWKRSIQKIDDIQPSALISSQESNDEVCQVCRSKQSRYTCPRCQMPYCCVACYKDHDGTDGCTEAFYKDRVSTVLHYEAKEQSQSMQRILSRSHPHMQQEEEVEVSQEELWRLAEALENDTVTDEDADELLTPEMRLAFERAVKNGELNELIDPWHPWWMPELVSSSPEEQLPSNTTTQVTLDDRLLQIPSFSTFRSGPLPDLTYNVVDLLYSVAMSLRLYHGVDNAVAASTDACQTLIQSCAVLRSDARHGSIAEALMACTAASQERPESNTAHWTVLAQDVIYLCSSRRHVSHALLEAIDILKAATKEIRSQGNADDAAHMRRMRKKLEYYLSWSREANLPAAELENEIRAWIEEWNGSNEQVADMDTLLLPKAIEQRQRRSEEKLTSETASKADSLMKEVWSTRKSE